MKRGRCLWCSHEKGVHDGRIDPAVKADPANRGVKWQKTGCSVRACACRRYES